MGGDAGNGVWFVCVQFKLYASGRRHCEFLVATLNLRARQDLVSQLW